MSKLEVDKVTPQSGTTLTIGDAGDTTVINGLGTLPATIGTAAQVLSVNAGATGLQYGTAVTDLSNLNATNLTSGTVPDARFPSTLPTANGQNLTAINPTAISSGTLPALNAANLTNLNATTLTSGTVPDARFPATLPAISGANLTNLPASGITNVDRWKMSNQNYSSGSTMTIGWSRDTILNGMPYGTGLTQSGGIFSFPSTGLYKIDIMSYIYNGNNQHTYVGIAMKGTSDAFSSNVQQLGVTYSNIAIAQGHANLAEQAIYKIDNTSNNKFKLMVETNTGTPGFYNTYITFMRLGDG